MTNSFTSDRESHIMGVYLYTAKENDYGKC